MRLISGARYARVLPPGLRRKLIRPWHTLLGWEQQIRERRLYSAFVRSRDLVFDIGANHGAKSAAFLSLGARVVAVEPDPWCVTLLERRFAREIAGGRITLVPHALGRGPGKVLLRQFSLGGRNASGSDAFVEAVASQVGPPVQTVLVEMIGADSLFTQFGVPAFMKVDVEGMDDEVLAGLSQKTRFLSFEFNLSRKLLGVTERCVGEVVRLGFAEANFTEAADTCLRLQGWVHPCQILDEIRRRPNTNAVWGDIVVR